MSKYERTVTRYHAFKEDANEEIQFLKSSAQAAKSLSLLSSSLSSSSSSSPLPSPLSSTSTQTDSISSQQNSMPDPAVVPIDFPVTVEELFMTKDIHGCVIVGLYNAPGLNKNKIVWRGPKGGLFFYNSANRRSLISNPYLVKFDDFFC